MSLVSQFAANRSSSSLVKTVAMIAWLSPGVSGVDLSGIFAFVSKGGDRGADRAGIWEQLSDKGWEGAGVLPQSDLFKVGWGMADSGEVRIEPSGVVEDAVLCPCSEC